MDCPNKPTMEELSLIRQERHKQFLIEEEERKRRNLAIKLGICPCCGSKIISQTIELFNVKFLGLVLTRSKRWDYRDICSMDKAHFENKGMYRFDSYGY